MAFASQSNMQQAILHEQFTKPRCHVAAPIVKGETLATDLATSWAQSDCDSSDNPLYAEMIMYAKAVLH